jgi:hypothetical protein
MIELFFYSGITCLAIAGILNLISPCCEVGACGNKCNCKKRDY